MVKVRGSILNTCILCVCLEARVTRQIKKVRLGQVRLCQGRITQGRLDHHLPTYIFNLFINPLTYDLTNQMITCEALKRPYNMSHFTTSKKNTTLGLVKRTILVVLDMLKSTCPRKLRWFFDPLSLWSTFWFENLV